MDISPFETDTDLNVDCNAIAPSNHAPTSIEIIGDLKPVDRQIDANYRIRPEYRDRFYASGTHVGDFASVDGIWADVRPLGDQIGLASAIKCATPRSKGLTALSSELLTAAELAEWSEALQSREQCCYLYQRDGRAACRGCRRSPDVWIGEMRRSRLVRSSRLEAENTAECGGYVPMFGRDASCGSPALKIRTRPRSGGDDFDLNGFRHAE